MKLKNIFFIVFLSILIACQNKSEQSLTFKINLGSEPGSLDPQLAIGNFGARMIEQMFLGLTTGDPKTGGYKPGLAESWNISEDGKTYTFYLRNGLTWSDGVPITAEGIRKSYLRVLDRKLGSDYASMVIEVIQNGQEYFDGKISEDKLGIKVIDDKTLEITLTGPKPYFPDMLAHNIFMPVPIHVIEKYGSNWTQPKYFVSSGPFKLKSRIINEKVILEKNERYYNSKNVILKEIMFFTTDNASTAYNMYQNYELDAVFNNISPDLIKEIKLRDDFFSNAILSTSFYSFNTKSPPFDNVKIRKALTLAIDRELLTNEVLGNGSIPTRNISPNFNNYNYGKKLILFDPIKARELLKEAGYPNGKNFPRVVVKYSTSELDKKVVEFLQNQWKKNLNISVELQNQEWSTYLTDRKNGNFEIIRGSWIGDYSDPLTFHNIYTTSQSMFSSAGFSDPEYDKLIEQSNFEKNPFQREKLLKKAEERVIEKTFQVIPLYINTGNYLFRKDKWIGWNPNVSERWSFANLKLIK